MPGFCELRDKHRAHSPVGEADRGDGRVLDLDIRMVDVVPNACDLFGRAHEPREKIELMGSLVDEDSAAFHRPRAAPGIGVVIGLVAPSEHCHLGYGWFSQRARINGMTDAPHAGIPAPLADHSEGFSGGCRGSDHGVAVRDGEGHRLFDEDVAAGLCGLDGDLPVGRVGRDDEDGLDPVFGNHFPDRSACAYAVAQRKGLALLWIAAADGDELAVSRGDDGAGVEFGNFAVADEAEA